MGLKVHVAGPTIEDEASGSAGPGTGRLEDALCHGVTLAKGKGAQRRADESDDDPGQTQGLECPRHGRWGHRWGGDSSGVRHS